MQNVKMQPQIIFIRGPPGIGKSMLKNNFRKLFPKGAFIEIDILREIHLNLNWNDDLIHEFSIDWSIDLAENLINKNISEPIFIIDTFSKGKLNKIIKSMKKPFITFSLYCDESHLKKRLESRPSQYYKDFNSALVINNDAKNSTLPNEIIVDTTKIESNELAKMIYDKMFYIGKNVRECG